LTYVLNATVTPPASAAAAFASRFSPDEFQFANNGPNPANPISKFLFIIPQSQGTLDVRLRIYDVNGRLVRTLVDGARQPGPHTALWNGRDDVGRSVASGNYFARIDMGRAFTKNMQVTILK
jgi:flagellar hook assembly protein FlgD